MTIVTNFNQYVKELSLFKTFFCYFQNKFWHIYFPNRLFDTYPVDCDPRADKGVQKSLRLFVEHELKNYNSEELVQAWVL